MRRSGRRLVGPRMAGGACAATPLVPFVLDPLSCGVRTLELPQEPSSGTMVQGVIIDASNRIVDINPSTGAVVALVPCSSPSAVAAAIARARDAQLPWSLVPLDERVSLLKAACAGLAARKDELVRTIVQEMGKVVAEAEEEVDGAIDKDAYLDSIVSPISVCSCLAP